MAKAGVRCSQAPKPGNIPTLFSDGWKRLEVSELPSYMQEQPEPLECVN